MDNKRDQQSLSRTYKIKEDRGKIVAFRGREKGRRSARGRWKGREREREGEARVWNNQLWEALLASICLEIDHMGAFLKSALSIDVKNNLKRSTLVATKSDTTSQRWTWSDG